MSDDKKSDGGVADDAAKRLAEQRKALNLQTQPLEVIADLDWGVDDDDAVFVPPPAAEPVKAEPVKAKPAAERAPVSSGGTMMMSTADFHQSLGAEPEPVKAQPAEPEAAPVEEPAAPQAAAAPQTDGGTMLMSTSAISAQLEQEAGVRAAQQTPLAAQDGVEPEAASDEPAQGEHAPQRPEWDEAPARETTAWANPNAPGRGGAVVAPEGRNLLYIAIAVVVAIILLVVLLVFVPRVEAPAQLEGAPAETSEEG